LRKKLNEKDTTPYQEAKKERDLYSAKEIAEFLMTNDDQNKKIVNIFYSLPLKWQKRILKNTKLHYKLLYDFLIQNKDN